LHASGAPKVEMAGWWRRSPQFRYSIASLLFLGPLLLAPSSRVCAQAPLPPIHYVYDELNRLIAVIDRDNGAAGYVYDAVGNILVIERFNVADIPGAIGITFVAPGKGKAGAKVTVYGKGFGTSAGQVGVSFNGTSATVDSVSGNRIATSVPAGATTGPITVTAPLGTATSPKSFRVLGPITIDPAAAQVPFGGTRQLTAVAQGGAAVAAFWDVNGIRGGSASIGTISTSGLYTAPSALGGPPSVTITATDRDDVSTSAMATLTILPPLTATTVSGVVSVAVATVNIADRSVTATTSVQIAHAAALTSAASATSVSVEPVITSVVPGTGTRGAISMLVTLTGAGLTGASAVTFLRNNAVDANLTVANIQVNGDGTQATAEITIAAGAATGARVLRITVPVGVSTAEGTSGNLFTVQ
jgi:YD repeat-containing protein